MYPMKPIFNLDANVEIPTCMYKLPIIQCSNPIGNICTSKVTSPVSMEALEARQDAILTRLEELKEQVKAYKKSLGLSDLPPPKACVSKTADIVIRCSPSYPAFTLKTIYSMLTANGYTVHATSHTHCSVNSLPPNVQSFLPITDIPRSSAQVRITLIWSEVGKDCELMVSPLVQTSIKGESNILRYFSRLFPTIFPYESLSNLMAVDNMLDSVSSLLWATPKERQPIMRTLAVNLANGSYLAGSLSIADLALYSAIRQMNFEKDLQPDLMKWYLTISKQLDGKANRNRNRNSSMRKSTCSPKKAEKGRTPDKDASPVKDSVKKNKSPAKEVKIEKCPPKKSGKENLQNNSNKGIHKGKDQLFEFFNDHGIKYSNIDHPEVFTVEAMMPYLKNVKGAICKNLFLKDKKKNFYLLSAVHDKEVKLNDVAKKIGAKELRFGDESIMFDMLGVSQGCVTAYALVNDRQKNVKFIVDSRLVDGSHDHVNFHPMVNTATTQMTTADFKRFLSLTGHNILEF